MYLINSCSAHAHIHHSLTVFPAFLSKSLPSSFFITLHCPPKQWDFFQPNPTQVLLLNMRSGPFPALLCRAWGEQICRASCEPSYENLGDVGFWDAYNLQGRNKPQILEEPWPAIFLASRIWQVERFVAGAKMLMVSMNLSFPQTLSSLLRAGAGLSGSSWLLHPKFQLEFCCKISSVISSFLLRKAKHKRSGLWHKKLRLLT